MKNETKIIILIILCLIFAILMIVGWVMYAKASDVSAQTTQHVTATHVTAAQTTGLLVILYTASSCKELTTKDASSVLVIPFDTCVPSGSSQYLKLIESDGKYIVSEYKDAKCTDAEKKGILTFNIDEIGKCVDIPPSSSKTMAIAYELYGPIKPHFFALNNE